jgi:four helix bundle protein
MKDEGRSDNGNGARDICRRTFGFAVDVVHLCKDLEQASGVWRTLGRQLLRSGTAIGANVEEAQGGQSRADFISKYAIARKEARETLYWLRLLRATDCASGDGLEHLTDEADQLVSILTAIIKSAERGR